jgi:hypothetical protein
MIIGTNRQTRSFGSRPGGTARPEEARTPPDAKARATAKLFRRAAAEVAVSEHEAAKKAQYANTERLRGLRLAKEAELAASKRRGAKRS